MATKYTHCGICLAACGLEVEVENNHVVTVRGDARHPFTRGFICPKGAASVEMRDDPLRVRHPYERIGSAWHRVGWPEALEKISRELREIVSKHGPNSVAMYYGAGTPTSSMNYMTADGFLRALGSDRMYNVLTLEFTNRYLVMEKMYGKQFSVTQPDLERTHCLLIFGSNPMVSLDHPGMAASMRALKQRGGRLIVVDPRTTETARIADIHAQIIPGTDLFMLRAMISHIFERKLQDAEFLKTHCAGYDFFEKWEPLSPEAAESICGVPAATIVRIAEEFADAQSACAICKLGINTSTHGTITYWLVEALNVITGNADREGGLIFNPGVLDLNQLSKMAIGHKRPKSRVGDFPYLTGSYPASIMASEILSEESDRIRALIVDAGDPSLVFPNSKKLDEALDRLDLIVSIDTYMNETAQRAHYILPTANFLEKDDLYITFPDHFPCPFAQWSHKVVEPPFEAMAEWEIFRDLSRCMCLPILNQRPLDLIFKLGDMVGRMIGRPGACSFTPPNYYSLLLGLMGKVKFRRLMSNPHGIKAGEIQFGAALRRLATPSHKVEVAPREFAEEIAKAVAVSCTDKFPFRLITGERSPHTKNTNLRGVGALTKNQSENFARINSQDAASLSVREGDMVVVSTANGSLEIQARVTDDIRKGVISIGHGWGRKLCHPDSTHVSEPHGVNANVLTGDASLDALSGMPVYNSLPCSIQKRN